MAPGARGCVFAALSVAPRAGSVAAQQLLETAVFTKSYEGYTETPGLTVDFPVEYIFVMFA
jgi:hypothetical protein